MNPSICPNCNEILLPGTNFCPKCGFQISQVSTAISIGRQIYIYVISLLLPPLGLIWTFKYLRHPTDQKKRIALIAAVLTVVSIIFSIWFTVGFFQGIQQQVNSYQNLGL